MNDIYHVAQFSDMVCNRDRLLEAMKRFFYPLDFEIYDVMGTSLDPVLRIKYGQSIVGNRGISISSIKHFAYGFIEAEMSRACDERE